MKTFLIVALSLFMTTAFAQEVENEIEEDTTIESEISTEEISPSTYETIRRLRCNIVKTPYYLMKVKSSVSKIPKCRTPKCLKKNTEKAEKNLCKAVHSCHSLNEYLENPCTPNNKLTSEAKAIAEGAVLASLKSINDVSVAYIDELLNRDSKEVATAAE